jgi:hypothetical protein
MVLRVGEKLCSQGCRVGMPTLFGVQGGENFLKGVPKDNFRKFFVISLKTKGGTKGKTFNLQF